MNNGNQVDSAVLLAGLLKYIQSYRVASAQLNENGAVFFPRMQVRGQLLELTLKAYLAARGVIAHGHDLEELAAHAMREGLILGEKDTDDRIQKVNTLYYMYKDRNEKYLSRYPDSKGRGGVWVTPGHEALDEMVQRILDQIQAGAK